MLNSEAGSILIFLLFITFFILLIILFISYLFYKYQQNQNVFKIQIEEIKINHDNELLRTRLQVQENTFQHIAREIHDNIGQKLTLAKLQLNSALVNKEYNSLTALPGTIQLLTDTLNDLRDISKGLNSDLITTTGLVKAIENEVNILNKSCNYHIILQVVGESYYLPADQELIVFRIVQESLSNIMKHADANQVIIQIEYSNKDLLTLKVIDNGIGFDRTIISEGSGLFNIRQRVLLLKGSCEIESSKGKGTVISIMVPTQSEQIYT